MHSFLGSADVAGAELAQRLRLALSELWASPEPRVLGSDSTHRRPRVGETGSATAQHLVAAEHALAAYTRRIRRVLETRADDVPFLAEPRLVAAPPVSGGPGVRVHLLRVSQAVEQLARLLEMLRPEDFGRKWRSEHGVCLLAELAERAVAIVVIHLEATARPTMFAAGVAGTAQGCSRRRQAIP